MPSAMFMTLWLSSLNSVHYRAVQLVEEGSDAHGDEELVGELRGMDRVFLPRRGRGIGRLDVLASIAGTWTWT